MRFSDQIVVVTGASRGIGRAIAQAFAAEGARVACVATTLDGAASTASGLDGAAAFACDVRELEQVERLEADVAASMGQASVLVNNAGVTRDGLLIRMKDEEWDAVLDVNLKGTFRMIRAFSRGMLRARYGRIVNLGSVIGGHGGVGQANYAAAKAGVEGLTKAVAKEFGSRGITANAIAPGFIETDMTAELPAEFRAFVEAQAPIGRLGSASDVAAAALYLASREAGYVTGQTLTVDGGLTM